MTKTLAFDVYGTLIDTAGVTEQIESMIGEKAHAFSDRWREKQLEYSFRRGLMQDYQNFAICTRDALNYTDTLFQTKLNETQKQSLLESYRVLPAFDDVEKSLQALKSDGAKMVAFSNGAADAVEKLLVTANIRNYFIDVVSTDEIQSFKPNPAVYEHLLKRTSSLAENTWLISSNPFDVLGALSSGLNSAWVQRNSSALFDPWGAKPTCTITSLLELKENI